MRVGDGFVNVGVGNESNFVAILDEDVVVVDLDVVDDVSHGEGVGNNPVLAHLLLPEDESAILSTTHNDALFVVLDHDDFVVERVVEDVVLVLLDVPQPDDVLVTADGQHVLSHPDGLQHLAVPVNAQLHLLVRSGLLVRTDSELHE